MTERLRNVTLACATTLLFGGLLEGAARGLEGERKPRAEYLWDWKERFHGEDFYTFERGEGYPPDEENNIDGLRDATRPVETRPGLWRIAVLGDSVAFGHGVEAHEAFPQLLEKKLRERGGDVDVLNVALPGWSTRQEHIAYERIAKKYSPNVVVLSICLNDAAELQNNLAQPPPWLATLYRRSALVRVVLGASRREIGAVEELFEDPEPPRVTAAYDRLFREIEVLAHAVREDGARFVLVVHPFRFQLEQNAPQPKAQSRIATLASNLAIPIIDLLPIAASSGGSKLFIDYDHWTPEGAAIVAEALAKSTDIAPPPRDGSLPEDGAVARERILATERGSRESCDLVSMAVDDPSPRVRFEAARVIFRTGLPKLTCVETLIRGVRHDDLRVRRFAIWTLGEMGEGAKAAIPALVERARADGGSGRTGASAAIAKIGGNSPEVIPLFVADLKHKKENRRIRAAMALGRLGVHAAPALAALREALNDESPTVRRLAIEAIGGCGEPARAAVEDIVRVMNKDQDPEVKQAAVRALSTIPGR